MNSPHGDIERLEQQLKKERDAINALTADLKILRAENEELKQESDQVREKDAILVEENRALTTLAKEFSSTQHTNGTSLHFLHRR